ncbi:MAG: RsmB/NOP family class I SAM-dependent RNA methyltransferase [Erysipelotrichaceae bacterium]|nr:RsmB/NOP family class I SAM-dependent RNA methyltransferase [Erysipelotrichaceae bacterium]
MISLPETYLSRMKELLKDEYQDYLDSFEKKKISGLRVNTLKISVEDFLKICPFELEPVPWCSDGFYFKEEDRPSRHPYYYAGLYYIQEPSAMLPAEILPVDEDDFILDACAAPGGKSAKLAARLDGSGLIVANDISASRAQVLLKTLETHGVRNSYVMAEDISTLDRFENCFDKILIDAPCSGEGMFRKDSELIRSWLEKDSSYYAPIQKKIITAAARMLKPGGMMVYSTCTFSIEEDEEVIEYALSNCLDLEVLAIEGYPGFVRGLTTNTQGCVRLYPHRIKGEGHFVALLQKKGERKPNAVHENKTILPDEPFFKDLNMDLHNGQLIRRDNRLFYEPVHDLDLKGLRILRSGLLLGEYKHERFEPSQALAMALKADEYKKIISFDADDERTIRYLKCETLDVRDKDAEGLVLVCADGYPLGFGKVSGGILKNRYPANYRYL